MHIWHLKCKSFQGPKAGPGPQPMFWTRFAHIMLQRTVGNIQQTILGPRPNPGSATVQVAIDSGSRSVHFTVGSIKELPPNGGVIFSSEARNKSTFLELL